MIVKDVMSRNIIACTSEHTILDVMRLMKDHNIGFIVIIDDKQISGVITDRDIVLSLIYNQNTNELISTIMKKDVITIDQYSHINDASDLFGNMQIRRLVVTNNGTTTGILSIADLARHILLEDNVLEAITEISYDFSTKKDSLIHIETQML